METAESWLEAVEDALPSSSKPRQPPVLPCHLDTIFTQTQHLARRIGEEAQGWKVLLVDQRDLAKDLLEGGTRHTKRALGGDSALKDTYLDLMVCSQPNTIDPRVLHQSGSVMHDEEERLSLLQMGQTICASAYAAHDWSQYSHYGQILDLQAPTVLADASVVMFVQDHELGHVVSQAQGFCQISPYARDKEFERYQEECRADGFAAVMSVLRYGQNAQAISHKASMRDHGLLLRHEVRHYTSPLLPAMKALGQQWAESHTIDTISPKSVMTSVEAVVLEQGFSRSSFRALSSMKDVWDHPDRYVALKKPLEDSKARYIQARTQAYHRTSAPWLLDMQRHNPHDRELLQHYHHAQCLKGVQAGLSSQPLDPKKIQALCHHTAMALRYTAKPPPLLHLAAAGKARLNNPVSAKTCHHIFKSLADACTAYPPLAAVGTSLQASLPPLQKTEREMLL